MFFKPKAHLKYAQSLSEKKFSWVQSTHYKIKL